MFSRPHPLSERLAVASLKRYIFNPEHQIQFSDLVSETVERVIESTSGQEFAVLGVTQPTTESIAVRLRRYESASSILLSLAFVGGFWARAMHRAVWQRALRRLGSRRQENGSPVWLELERYPAVLLLYALGLGAVSANLLTFLKDLLAMVIRRKHKDVLVIEALLPHHLLTHHQWGLVHEHDGNPNQSNSWVYDTLRSSAKSIIFDDNEYLLTFDKLEILIALRYTHIHQRIHAYYFSNFSFIDHYDIGDQIPHEIEQSILQLRAESPYVKCGLFGNSVVECEEVVETVRQTIRKISVW